MRDQLISAMANAIEQVRQWPKKEVQIFHHNDSDGLSSGAILTRTFERAGYEIKRFCLEKPYPALLEKIYAQEKLNSRPAFKTRHDQSGADKAG